MKNILAITGIIFISVAFIVFFIEYSRPYPDNLTVFVLATEQAPTEFYSSPQAYELLQSGKPLAKMPLSLARQMKLKMAEGSKNDFSCFHSFAAWWLVDRGWWPNSCRWTKDGRWQ